MAGETGVSAAAVPVPATVGAGTVGKTRVRGQRTVMRPSGPWRAGQVSGPLAAAVPLVLPITLAVRRRYPLAVTAVVPGKTGESHHYARISAESRLNGKL
jgi:hypothetical protein